MPCFVFYHHSYFFLQSISFKPLETMNVIEKQVSSAQDWGIVATTIQSSMVTEMVLENHGNNWIGTAYQNDLEDTGGAWKQFTKIIKAHPDPNTVALDVYFYVESTLGGPHVYRIDGVELRKDRKFYDYNLVTNGDASDDINNWSFIVNFNSR